LQSLKISETRAITMGSGIIIAVLDTGTYPHPDLRRNLLRGVDETDGGNGDGQTDTVGHGTNMASIIAAPGRSNDKGIQGIAPSAKIVPIRVGKTGKIDEKVLASGIHSAISRSAKVINISATVGPDFGLMDAVSAAIEDGVVVVAAAGNTSKVGSIGYPGVMDDVLTVGATGRNGNHASISVDDPHIDICAPGVDIVSAQPKDKYVTANGTSESTAIVSGAVALVRAKFPQLSVKDVMNRLTATADDIGPPGRDDECGFGRLNIVKALTADVPPLGGAPSSAPSVAVSAPAITAAAPTATGAVPEAEPAGSSMPLVLGGLVGVVAVGGLIAFLAIRRRRNF
jgi:type VII secretion-associated serine protease mycosin